MRPILLTGMSGFVGERIARHLVAKGRAVAGTYLANPISIPGADALPLDLTDGGAVRRLVRDMRPAAVVHCAAATKANWCETNREAAHAAIVGVTQHLCSTLADQAPETPFIHFSTDLVFGGDAAPYAEAATAKPLNHYGSLKWLSEEPVRGLRNGMVLRSALVFGPPGTHQASFISWMVEALARGKPLTLFRDEWRTPVFVDDLASAVDLLLDTPTTGRSGNVFHAGGPDRLNRVEMGEALCAVFGLPMDGFRVVTRDEVEGGSLRARDVSLSCDRLRALGWKPTPFRDGLSLCLDQWKPVHPARG